MKSNKIASLIPGGINVLGISFHAFIHPDSSQPFFSQRGIAKGLKIPESTLRMILCSKEFNALYSKGFSCAKILTEVSPNPVSALSTKDLICIVKFLSDKRGYPVAKSMQDAGFPIVLQQSIDQAIGETKRISEYLELGSIVRSKLEYLNSYHSMKDSVFSEGYGVSGLCNVNSLVSSIAVPDAELRRATSKGWRRKCSPFETLRLTVGNFIYERAVNSSSSKADFIEKCDIALERTQSIYDILDASF